MRVTTDRPNCPLRVFDPLGRLVSQHTTDAAGEVLLDMHPLAPGVYTVRGGALARRLLVE